MKYILIARVSTDKQEDSLEAQKERAQQWALMTGNELVLDERFLRVESGKGKDILRQSVHQALVEIVNKKADGIIVTKLDRLSRSLKDLITISENIRKNNAQLVVIDQQIDTSTPTGRLYFNLLGTFAEFEREMIIERTREMMQRRKAMNLKTGGYMPFGKEKMPGQKYLLKDNKKELEVVDYILLLKHRDKLGYEAIANRLNKEEQVTKRNKTWHKETVRRICTRYKDRIVQEVS